MTAGSTCRLTTTRFLKIRFRSQLRFTERIRNDAWRDPGEAKNFPELLGVFGDYRANRSENNATSFNVRRLRFYFMGHLFDPDFKYYIQFRSETAENAQTPGALSLLDMNFTSTHFKWANVQLGQYKVYFNRSQINSTASMQFADRSLVQDAFTASGLDRRDIGITIMNDEELFPINYYFRNLQRAGPSFNRLGSFASEEATIGCPGGQTGGNPFPSPSNCPVNQRNLNANTRFDVDRLLYVARLNWNILEGRAMEKATWRIPSGHNWPSAVDIPITLVSIRVPTTRLSVWISQFEYPASAGSLWQRTTIRSWDCRLFHLGGRRCVQVSGLLIAGEFYYKMSTGTIKGLPCMNAACTATAPNNFRNATGFYVRNPVTILIPRTLELAGRFSYWDPDTNSAGDLIRQTDASLNWFLNGTYDHQIMLTYSNTQFETGGYAIGRSAPLPPDQEPCRSM